LNSNDLRHKRGVLLRQAQQIVDKGKLSQEDEREYNRLIAESEELKKLIEHQELLDELNRSLPKPGEDNSLIPFTKTKPKEEWRNAITDEAVRVYRPDEEIRRLGKNGEENFSIGRFIKGVTTGDWKGAEVERRTMVEGTLGSGGYLVPAPLSNEIINLARNKAAVVQAGARTVIMDASTLKIARVAGDFAPYWRAENEAITVSDMSFETVTFEARTLAAYGKMSIELAEDAPNIDVVIRDSLASALALELDRVALLGSGSGAEPTGLANVAGITELEMGENGGALTDYDKLVDLYYAIAAANGQANAAIMAPRTAGELEKLKEATGNINPAKAPESWVGLKKFVTNQIPIDQVQGTSDDASTVFMGDFSKLMVGMRTPLVIELSRVAHDGTDSAFNKMQVHIRAYLRADVQLAVPAHLGQLIGIIPA